MYARTIRTVSGPSCTASPNPTRPSRGWGWRTQRPRRSSRSRIFHLHPLAVEDAIVAHQRPKIERYDDTLCVVLRPASYDDATETVHLGELHLFVGPDFVVTVRHSDEPKLTPVCQRMDDDPHLMTLGPEAVLYAILDFVVDGYAPEIAGLETTST